MRYARSMSWSIAAEHLERARQIVAEHARRTPLRAAPELGPHVYLKLETEQDTGSFKLRGALVAISVLDTEARARGVVTASAGNHGYGLARAGALLGVPITVFVGRSTPSIKREGIRAAGAVLEVVDAEGYDAVEARARLEAERRGVPFVSPFDDPLVAAGNGGTLAFEILEDLPSVRTIIAPVGGGGLVAGLAAGRRHAAADFALVGVQSDACPAMAESFREGRALLTYAGGPTLAEGLEGGVSEATYAIAREELARMETVSEAAIADALAFAHRELGLVLEGSAAVGLAWLREHLADIETPAVVVVTGRNVDPKRFAELVAG